MCMTPVWRWVDAAFCAPLHHGERSSLACELQYVARQMSGVFALTLRLTLRTTPVLPKSIEGLPFVEWSFVIVRKWSSPQSYSGFYVCTSPIPP